MLHPEDITGVVLAGGKSSRFGSNKALSRYGKSYFLQHIVRKIQPYTKEVVVAGFYPEYQMLGVPVWKDVIPDSGPLGGILTALTYCSTPWILVLTCDMPLISNEIIMQMMAAGRGEAIIGWRHESTPGVFPLLLSKSLLPHIEAAIEEKRFRVKQLFDWGNACLIPIPDELQHLFANINNQEEYNRILS
ncbi:hypothetical protein A9168_11240 [Macellibacteroides sp. HH-ZS]|nr:hypothetical protein A9168_11240 [Macellibacteroides sp. HH-ZS]